MSVTRATETTALAAIYPYTCEWCSNSPASHMAVYDYSPPQDSGRRFKHLVCGRCAHGVTILPDLFKTWWLFRLMLDDGCVSECEAAINHAIAQVPPTSDTGNGSG